MPKKASRKTSKHTLITIGYLGDKRVYLDIPLAEAKHRYAMSEDSDPESDRVDIEQIDFDDEFGCYDVWE